MAFYISLSSFRKKYYNYDENGLLNKIVNPVAGYSINIRK